MLCAKFVNCKKFKPSSWLEEWLEILCRVRLPITDIAYAEVCRLSSESLRANCGAEYQSEGIMEMAEIAEARIT